MAAHQAHQIVSSLTDAIPSLLSLSFIYFLSQKMFLSSLFSTFFVNSEILRLNIRQFMFMCFHSFKLSSLKEGILEIHIFTLSSFRRLFAAGCC